jgi:hypothetical protein
MNAIDLIVQILVTFVAAFLGAYLTRRTEHIKHLGELRAVAYADFLRGFARVGRAQSDEMSKERRECEELEGRAFVTDARSRILIYGGKDVVHALAQFATAGMQTLTPEGRKEFAHVCALMRAETGKEEVRPQDIETVLFG